MSNDMRADNKAACKDAINAAYEKYSCVTQNETEQNAAYRRFFELLMEQYALYLNECYKGESENVNSAFDALFSNPHEIYMIVKRFDTDKNNFFSYFDSIAYGIIKKAQSREKISNTRLGINLGYGKKMELYLSRLLKIAEEMNGGNDELSEEKYAKLCDSLGISHKAISKLKEMYMANRNANVLSLYIEDDDGNEQEIYVKSNTLIEDSIEKALFSDEDRFEDFLLRLNDIYKELSSNRKKILQLKLTNNYIIASVDEICERENVKGGRNVVVEHYWSFIQLEDKRDTYATGKYYAMWRALFDKVIEKRRLYQDNELIKCRGLGSAAYVSKEYKKIIEVVLKRIKADAPCYAEC